MHWARLVLGNGHPVIVVAVLALVGAFICWFSLQQIAALTKIPTRYTMDLAATTEGCSERPFELNFDVGSFGPSFLQIWLLDGDGKPRLTGGCRMRSIGLTSTLPLDPMDDAEFAVSERTEIPVSTRLMRITGADVDDLREQAEADPDSRGRPDTAESVAATIVDGALRALNQTTLTEAGPSFALRDGERRSPFGVLERSVEYVAEFPEQWQPIVASYSFTVPENIRTYFDINAFQVEEMAEARVEAGEGGTEEAFRNVDAPPRIYTPMQVSVSFRIDEVSVVRGTIADSGLAKSIQGSIQFGIENNDAESRRESGNVRYSAVLGIGIALLVEAFVILLALGMRALASRLGLHRP